MRGKENAAYLGIGLHSRLHAVEKDAISSKVTLLKRACPIGTRLKMELLHVLK